MYEQQMRKCFRLALKGEGKVSPNPLVGCVVLDKAGKEISSGYHHCYGSNHAEREALLKLDKTQTIGGTLIVNLEPCNHYGKTPPCSDLIIEYGIKRVVISNIDPNPKAAGGVKKLQNAGIEVITGVLEEEGALLNRVFFKNIKDSKPYIVSKIATTIDGKIATKTGDSKWITSENSRRLVKRLREKYDAILTTSATVLADNPQMKHSLKIILDRKGKLDFSKKIFEQGQILLMTANSELQTDKKNITVIKVNQINEKLDLTEIIAKAWENNIKSIFIEAGGNLNGEIVRQGLADEIIHFVAPKILNDNTGRSCFDGDDVEFIASSKNFKLIELKQSPPYYYARYILK